MTVQIWPFGPTTTVATVDEVVVLGGLVVGEVLRGTEGVEAGEGRAAVVGGVVVRTPPLPVNEDRG
jgi:hypothetical protein